jgi:energy-coupling factor transporter ATP-binding protein EcfA2
MDRPSVPPSLPSDNDREATGGVPVTPDSHPPDSAVQLTPTTLSLSGVAGPFTSGSIPVLSPEQEALLAASERLRQELGDVALSFDVPGAQQAMRERDDVLERLDTFVLPRLRRIDAPLLVVVGGSAGSGKSTLTNSLVGVRVSPEGLLRPTTRAPVLAHHPRDSGAFLSRRILPGLARITATGAQSLEPEDATDVSSRSIRLVPHWAVTPGLAIIDSPDLNSRVEGNRELARQLFGVADLWVFVATSTDYANAAPWELLAEAVERQVSVAVVLNRMREPETGEVRHHFATMLRDAGLASAAFFTMPETVLDKGLLPSWRMVALQTWLARQVGDAQARDGHVRRAVVGTLAYVGRRCEQLVDAVRAQAELERRLREDLVTAFAPVLDRLHRRVDDGAMIGPDVEAVWRAAAGSAESTSRPGRWLSRGSTGPAWQPTIRHAAVAEALRAGIVSLVHAESQTALGRLADLWHGQPGIAEIAEKAGLFAVPDDFAEQAEQLLLHWQQAVEARVSGTRPGGGGQTPAAAAAAVAVLTLAVGADAGWIGPPARALAETRLSRGEIRELVPVAREQLHGVLAELLELAGGRPQAMLDEMAPGGDRPEALRAAVEDVRQTLAAVH